MLRKRLLGVSFAVVALIACGESLIKDPSFDLWCGDKLCDPWESSGRVTRVKTWHRSDYGVALDDDAMLSQLATKSQPSCIEFEVIADVVASADVWLEMDFDDDGQSEYKQMIPESHWAKLTFNASAPSRYDSVRFILRKAGHGRAVLAQIKATPGSGCQPTPLPATHRDNGQSCSDAPQCDGGACEDRSDALSARGTATKVCGECSSTADCPDDMRCGSARGKYGVYAACVPFEQSIGALCGDDGECESRHCLEPLPMIERSCAECASDDDCASGQVCGAVVTELGPTLACRERQQAALGTLCASDAECASGVCAHQLCSECDDTRGCAAPSVCKPFHNTSSRWFVAGTALCDGQTGAREAGDVCNEDADCLSHGCTLPHSTCYLCQGDSCPVYADADCFVSRQLPGTCR